MNVGSMDFGEQAEGVEDRRLWNRIVACSATGSVAVGEATVFPAALAPAAAAPDVLTPETFAPAPNTFAPASDPFNPAALPPPTPPATTCVAPAPAPQAHSAVAALRPEWHRKGLATAAFSVVMHDWAIPQMGCTELRAECLASNIGSVKVWQKYEFVEDPELRSAFVFFFSMNAEVKIIEAKGGGVEQSCVLIWSLE
ncbi:hypothetical protein K438DRAFT_1774613 [Mycena galopus ATCC 62051]|nr:hypothetical protein K438DRAFT_1774613 [Mycena galopus ATCC 62051]